MQKQTLIRMKENLEYYKDMVEMFFKPLVSQMTIYCYYHGMTPKFCDSQKEVVAFENSDKISFVSPSVIEYIGTFAGRTDVIRKTTEDGQVKYCTPIDDEHYAIYDEEKSKKFRKHVWNNDIGSLKDTYNAFRERGIVFENDIYQKLEVEEQRLILEMKNYVQNRRLAI